MTLQEEMTLREAAEQWMREHPEAMALFRGFAVQMLGAGRRFGFRLLAERVRWEFAVGGAKGEFKLNDHYTPYIARAIASEIPEIAGIIECRVTKAADKPERAPRRRPQVDPLTDEPLGGEP